MAGFRPKTGYLAHRGAQTDGVRFWDHRKHIKSAQIDHFWGIEFSWFNSRNCVILAGLIASLAALMDRMVVDRVFNRAQKGPFTLVTPKGSYSRPLLAKVDQSGPIRADSSRNRPNWIKRLKHDHDLTPNISTCYDVLRNSTKQVKSCIWASRRLTPNMSNTNTTRTQHVLNTTTSLSEHHGDRVLTGSEQDLTGIDRRSPDPFRTALRSWCFTRFDRYETVRTGFNGFEQIIKLVI